VRTGRLDVWDKRVARAASRCPIDAEIGKIWADELPWTLADLLALPGVGPHTAVRLTQDLLRRLLDDPYATPFLAGKQTHCAYGPD